MEVKETVRGEAKWCLRPGKLTLAKIESILHQPIALQLSSACKTRIDASYHCVQAQISAGEIIYGVNTGFGSLANQVINKDKIHELQRHLLLSHAAGVGKLLEPKLVRLIILLKINSLAQGYSGIRYQLLKKLIALYNSPFVPCVPEKGSVGASGDLAPLAHCFLPLIGEGEVLYHQQRISSKKVLAELSFETLVLKEKEGLALINGTQVSTAIALAGLVRARECLLNAVTIGALTTMVVGGNPLAFSSGIQRVRNQQGQSQVGQWLRDDLKGYQSPKLRVQDPYCIRCQPQVLGACWDAITHACDILVREANAVTDNPLVFAQENLILSGGNFHAEPVAMICDYLALALAEIGSLSERRLALLVDGNLSGLPAFLAVDPGLHSGFMIAHVTAASLASENKQLATPASIDSLPTSANQEDHVSMATNAARRLLTIADNVTTILVIEIMAAHQGKLLASHPCNSVALTPVWGKIAKKLPLYADDGIMNEAINALKTWLFQEGGVLKKRH